MIEKSKKTSEVSEKKAEPAKPSAANTLKSGLSGAKESNTPTAPGGSAAKTEAPASPSPASASKAPGGTTPAAPARPGDEIRSSSELQEKGRSNRPPQVGMLDQLRDVWGDGESGHISPSRAWSSKIGDILTGNSGRLRDLAGLSKPVDTDNAQDPNGIPAKDSGDVHKPANLWEKLWGIPAPQPKEQQHPAAESPAEIARLGAKDPQSLQGDYRAPSDSQVQHNWGEESLPRLPEEARSESARKATQGLEHGKSQEPGSASAQEARPHFDSKPDTSVAKPRADESGLRANEGAPADPKREAQTHASDIHHSGRFSQVEPANQRDAQSGESKSHASALNQADVRPEAQLESQAHPSASKLDAKAQAEPKLEARPVEPQVQASGLKPSPDAVSPPRAEAKPDPQAHPSASKLDANAQAEPKLEARTVEPQGQASGLKQPPDVGSPPRAEAKPDPQAHPLASKLDANAQAEPKLEARTVEPKGQASGLKQAPAEVEPRHQDRPAESKPQADAGSPPRAEVKLEPQAHPFMSKQPPAEVEPRHQDRTAPSKAQADVVSPPRGEAQPGPQAHPSASKLSADASAQAEPRPAEPKDQAPAVGQLPQGGRPLADLTRAAKNQPSADANAGADPKSQPSVVKHPPADAGEQTKFEADKAWEVKARPSEVKPQEPAQPAKEQTRSADDNKDAREKEAQRLQAEQAARAMSPQSAPPQAASAQPESKGVDGVGAVKSGQPAKAANPKEPVKDTQSSPKSAKAENKAREDAIDQATRNLSGAEKAQVEHVLRHSKIDDELLKQITKDGFAINVIDSDSQSLKDDHGKIHAGRYDYTDNKIRLSEQAFKDPQELQKVLNDELGHRIDDKLRTNPETSQKWSSLMKEYAAKEHKDIKIDKNAASSQGEFGSEVISAYLQGGKDEANLKKAYPELYDIVKNTVGKSDQSQIETQAHGLFGRFAQAVGAQKNQLQGNYFSDTLVAPKDAKATSAEPSVQALSNKGSSDTPRASNLRGDQDPAKKPPTNPPQAQNVGDAAANRVKSPPGNPSPEAPTAPNSEPAPKAPNTQPPAASGNPGGQNQNFPTQNNNSGQGNAYNQGNSYNQSSSSNYYNSSSSSNSYNNAFFNNSNLSSFMDSTLFNQFEQSGLGNLLQDNAFQSLGLAQQDLMALDQSLSQAGGLQELQKLSQGLQGLDGLPQQLKGLDGLKELAPMLQNVPETLEGLGKVQSLVDRAQNLPGNPKDFAKNPDVRSLLRELPGATKQVAGLSGLAAGGSALSGQLSSLSQVRQVGDNLQQLGKATQEWKDLPGKLGQVSQALPIVKTAQQEGSLPTAVDSNFGQLRGAEQGRRDERPQSAINPSGRSLLQGENLSGLRTPGGEPVQTQPGSRQQSPVTHPEAPVVRPQPGVHSETPVVRPHGQPPAVQPGVHSETPVMRPPVHSQAPAVQPGIHSETPVVRPPVHGQAPAVQPGAHSETPVRPPVHGQAPAVLPGGRSDTPVRPPAHGQAPAVQPGAHSETPVMRPPVQGQAPAVQPGGRSETPVRPPAHGQAPAVQPGAHSETPVVRPHGQPPAVPPGGHSETPVVRPPVQGQPPAVHSETPVVRPQVSGEAPLVRTQTSEVRPHSPGEAIAPVLQPAPRLEVAHLRQPLSPMPATPSLDKLDAKLTDRLQAAPLLARQLDKLPQAQNNLKKVVTGLENSSQQPKGLEALHRTAQDPGTLHKGLERLEQLVESPEDKSNVQSLRRTLEPVLTQPGLREGLKEADRALKPLGESAGRQQIMSLKRTQLDTPVTRELAQQLREPAHRAPRQRVSEGVSQARELERATEAQHNLMPQLSTEMTQDLGESLAKIISEAQAANRPRSLFGIQLGGGGARPAGAATPARPAQASPAPAVSSPPQAQPQVQSPPQVQAAVGPAKPGPMPKAPAGQPKENMSKARIDAYRQTYETVKEQMIGKAGKDHAWALVYHSRDAEGAKGLTDTLESNVVKGGSGKMQSWIKDMTKSPDSAVALSAILANVANVAPDRMMGIMLLTTDGAGGKETIGDAFNKMSRQVDSSLRLSHFLEKSSQHPAAARGLAELLEGQTEAQGDSWKAASRTAETFRGMSETVGGARRLTQTLENLGEVEGGNRLVARMVNRMSREPEGASNTLETLQNLAHDREGAGQLGRVLARASESRDGARDLLHSFQNMSKTSGGKQDVARLLVRLAEGGQGARLLANFVKDGNNSGNLAGVFDQLNQNPESRALLAHALDQMAKNPRQRSNYEVFAGRVAASDALQEVLKETTGENDKAADPSEAIEKQPELARLRPLPGRALENPAEVADPILHKPADLQRVSESWRSERPSAAESQAPAAASALAQAEKPSDTPADLRNFRPGDVYSEETLRHARICGDCGGRTTSMGLCPRCATRKRNSQAQAV